MKLPPLVAKIWGNGKFLLFMARSSTERPYLLRWLNSLRPNYLLTKPIPWTTFHAIDFLSEYLRPGFQVFEYGSGGSTLFFLQHGVNCISIEHDTKWYELIKNRFASDDLDRIDYRLISPQALSSGCSDPADPDCYVSADAKYIGMDFRNYVHQISEFPDGYFDVVFIDGRARTSCIVHAAPKVKIGGLLVLDNSDRAYYTEKLQILLRDFESRNFSGVLASRADLDQCTVYMRRI